MLDLNFTAAVRCTRAAASHLLKSKGHIVNIGSLASKSATKYLGAYPVSKHAIAAYSLQLRMELVPEGLHVLLRLEFVVRHGFTPLLEGFIGRTRATSAG